MYTMNLAELKTGNPYAVQPDPNIELRKQIPVRVVLNNETFSVFAGDSFTSQVVTFNIAETDFGRSSANPKCFILGDEKKTGEFCPFGSGEGDMVEEWDYDYNQFKIQCKSPRDKVEAKFQTELKQSLDEKLETAKQQVLLDKEIEIKKKTEERDEQELKVKLKQTNKLALEAIAKEMDIESMIREEEYEREEQKQEEITKKIEEEEKKNEALFKRIREKQLENQFNMRTEETKKEIEETKEDAAKQITISRAQLRKKLKTLQKQSKITENKLTQNLEVVRKSMGKQLKNVYKIGDETKCNKNQSEQQKRMYCTASFSDPVMYSSCKETEFCFICCDNEFGEMYPEKRLACNRNQCENPPQPEPVPKEPNGNWKFVPKNKDIPHK